MFSYFWFHKKLFIGGYYAFSENRKKYKNIDIYNIPAMRLLLSLSLDISLVHIFVAKTHQNKVNQCNNSPN